MVPHKPEHLEGIRDNQPRFKGYRPGTRCRDLNDVKPREDISAHIGLTRGMWTSYLNDDSASSKKTVSENLSDF